MTAAVLAYATGFDLVGAIVILAATAVIAAHLTRVRGL